MPTGVFNAKAELAKCALNEAQTLFAPGLNDREITLYRQQVRALNLAYLIQESRGPSSLHIGIVGAGGCGITLAAALLLMGHRVTLFERQDDFMYLQKGCETRYLHPNSYNWPAYGSDVPFAILPFLSWRAASASSVARQILDRFREIRSHPASKDRFTFRKRSLIQVNDVSCSVDWQAMESSDSKYAGTDKFDLIALCVGFGIESEVNDKQHLSYWRNDNLNQVRADSYAASRSEWWVSGAGDGGLIDVQRLTIRDYDQSRFVFDVWGASAVIPWELSGKLREFHTDVLRDVEANLEGDALYAAIEKRAGADVVRILDEFLAGQLRKDTFVVLNSKEPHFKQVLGLKKQSFLNALVTHRLYNKAAFVYHGGDMPDDRSHPMRLKHHPQSEVIVRHGADRMKHLEAGWPEAGDNAAKLKGAGDRTHPSERLWPVGWWQKTIKAEYDDAVPGGSTGRVEFCSADIETIFDGYATGLSGIIANYQLMAGADVTAEYRVCVHRVLNVDGKAYYQQITRYSGTNPSGLVGRVFDLDSGAAGLACALGQTVVVRLDDSSDTKRARELWARLRLLDHGKGGGMRNPPPKSRLYVAVPILVDNCEQAQNGTVGYILYLDSETTLFADDPDRMFEFVNLAFTPFADSILEMQKSRRVFFNAVAARAPFEWAGSHNMAAEFPEFLKVNPLFLKMPSGVSTEVNLNRYQEILRHG